MKVEYLFIPQWQDSGKTNELYNGSFALMNYSRNLIGTELTEIIVEESGPLQVENSIYGYPIIREQLLRVKERLEINSPDKTVTIGGGCGVEVPIVSYLNARYGRMQVFWFDAHGDLNSPESSPSKYFHGMPLRFLVERQLNDIGSWVRTVPAHRVHLVGVRDLDPPEEEFIARNSLDVIRLSAHYFDDIFSRTTVRYPAYVHIDLDVLDPGDYKNVKCPVKNGIKIETLVETVRILKHAVNVVGISIVENTETDENKIEPLHALIREAVSI